MAAGKLYTFPQNFRAYRALVAAQYAGVTVNVVSEAPEFIFGETNKSADFLAKFPLGKVPAFEAKDGTCLFEANAIASYVGENLRGSNKTEQAQVEQWISFADNEIVPAACTLAFPCLGLMQFNKQAATKAKDDLKVAVGVLDNHLKTRTFLVGERVSQADITVCTSLLQAFQLVLEPEFRKPFINVVRWCTTLVNQSQFKAVIGDFKFCESAASFDSARYNELHGGKKEGGKKEAAKGKKTAKAAPKEEAKKAEEPQQPAGPPPFCMDLWKKTYRNSDIKESIPFFWDNFDPTEYSIYRCDYQYLEDLPKEGFMCSNLISGMLQRLDCIRKVAFGLIAYFKVEDKVPFRLSGVWFWKHTGNIFDGRTDLVGDHESYKWIKMDPNNAKDKDWFNQFLECEGAFDGMKMEDIKMFV